jgi:lipid-A-disaccharide synthase
LEAGFFEIPMIVVYKTSSLTYIIGKKLIRLKNIGMVNILLNDNVVPELIQKDVTKSKIYKTGKEILANEKIYSSMKEKLSGVKRNLGTAGASVRAARQIYTIINEA